MEVRIVKAIEVASPTWREARLLDHIFETLALTCGDQSELCPARATSGQSVSNEELALAPAPSEAR